MRRPPRTLLGMGRAGFMRLHTRYLALAATVAVAALAMPASAPATETLSCTLFGLYGADPGVGGTGQWGESRYSMGASPKCNYSNTATGVHVAQAPGSMDSNGT